MKTLKKGMKGDEVKELQNFLKIKSDGDFGKKTETAVKDFQRKNSISCIVINDIRKKYAYILFNSLSL